jgi:hypothetical protein
MPASRIAIAAAVALVRAGRQIGSASMMSRML